MKTETVLRVGVYNNFNFTEQEIAKVKEVCKGDTENVFVNSNSFVTIKPDFPSILTINPYLDSFVEPQGDLSNVKACRIKVVYGGTEPVRKAAADSIKWCAEHRIPMLFTFMRFCSKQTRDRFAGETGQNAYGFRGSYWRLNPEPKQILVDSLKIMARDLDAEDLVYFCDLAGKGCPACNNCARLACGRPDLPVSSLTLSCSGDCGKCIFHCPDCWAHKLEKIAKFKLDEITTNNKQKGHSTK